MVLPVKATITCSWFLIQQPSFRQRPNESLGAVFAGIVICKFIILLTCQDGERGIKKCSAGLLVARC